MSDWLIDYLRQLRREDPDNPQLERMLRFEHRRLEARGNRGRPPARTLERARQKLLAGMIVPHGSALVGEGEFSIDAEIRQLYENNSIKYSTKSEADKMNIDPVTLEDAIWIGRLAIIDGCAWGDYYARYKLGREPSRIASAKLALTDTRELVEMIREYLYAHSTFLVSSENRKSLTPQVDDIRTAQDALKLILAAVQPEAADKGGRPGDPWKIGFVFGISHRWTTLTKFRISDSERFVSFVTCGAEAVQIGPRDQSDTWSSAIRTAIGTFGLFPDGRTWLTRPGERRTTNPPP